MRSLRQKTQPNQILGGREFFRKALITSAVMQCKSLLSAVYCASTDPIQNTHGHQNCVFVSSLNTQLSGLDSPQKRST